MRSMRLHRRLRRLSRRQPAEHPGRVAAHLRARLPVRLARRAIGDAAGLARADLLEPRARLCPVQHALGDAQPLLRAVRARRQGRELERRRLLGRAACPPRPEGGGRSRHRAVDREEHRRNTSPSRASASPAPATPRTSWADQASTSWRRQPTVALGDGRSTHTARCSRVWRAGGAALLAGAVPETGAFAQKKSRRPIDDLDRKPSSARPRTSACRPSGDAGRGPRVHGPRSSVRGRQYARRGMGDRRTSA